MALESRFVWDPAKSQVLCNPGFPSAVCFFGLIFEHKESALVESTARSGRSSAGGRCVSR
jgi:hypothetical protein